MNATVGGALTAVENIVGMRSRAKRTLRAKTNDKPSDSLNHSET